MKKIISIVFVLTLAFVFMTFNAHKAEAAACGGESYIVLYQGANQTGSNLTYCMGKPGVYRFFSDLGYMDNQIESLRMVVGSLGRVPYAQMYVNQYFGGACTAYKAPSSGTRNINISSGSQFYNNYESLLTSNASGSCTVN